MNLVPLPLALFWFGEILLSHGNNAPRKVSHLFKRRLAVRSGRVGRFHFFLPRFSWRLRLASRRSGCEVFSGQTLVGQALAHDGAHNVSEAEAVILFPKVEAESLLVQVSEHVERVNANVGALDGALQERPEAFESVGVNQTIDVPLGVVNDTVMEVLSQATIAAPLVGVERGTLLDMGVNLTMKVLGVDVVNDSGVDGRMSLVISALHDAQDRDLGTYTSLLDDSRTFRLVHVFGESTNESLVGFDVARHLLEALGLHGQTDTPEHEPRGFLSNAQATRHFVGADAVLAVGQHPDSGKPLVQSKRRVLKDRPHLDRELLPADAALPDTPSLEEHRVRRVTMGAHDARRPAKELKELERDIRISEVGHRFAKGLRSLELCHTVNLC